LSKSRKKWERQEINAKFCSEKPEEKRPLAKLTHIYEDNIKMDLG
jgi:hypothetical protein